MSLQRRALAGLTARQQRAVKTVARDLGPVDGRDFLRNFAECSFSRRRAVAEGIALELEGCGLPFDPGDHPTENDMAKVEMLRRRLDAEEN